MRRTVHLLIAAALAVSAWRQAALAPSPQAPLQLPLARALCSITIFSAEYKDRTHKHSSAFNL